MPYQKKISKNKKKTNPDSYFRINKELQPLVKRARQLGEAVSLNQTLESNNQINFCKNNNIFKNLLLDRDFALCPDLNPTGGPRISFSRGTAATQINKTGLIEYAPENLLLQSQNFNTPSVWLNDGSVFFQDNVAIAPDNTKTATFIGSEYNDGQHFIYQQIDFTGKERVCFSVYAKAGTFQNLWINVADEIGQTTVDFDLVTGQATNIQIADYATQSFSKKITNIGNGWYRCEISLIFSDGGPKDFMMFLSNGYGIDFQGDTSGIYIWGAQVERTTIARPYLRTTTSAYYAPRFTRDPATLQSLGLLVEESRANLALWSEDFSNAAWGKVNVAVTANTLAAPDGTTTADLITQSAADSVISQNLNPNSTTVTSSFFIKKSVGSWIRVFQTGTGCSAWFNLDTGLVGTVTGTGTTAATAKITAFLNGWYRVEVSATFAATNTSITSRVSVVLADNSTTASSSGAYYLWGGQVEAGAFATSYIPTTTTTATRAADLVTMTGTNFSSWYNQSEGAFVVECIPARAAATAEAVIAVNDAGTSNRFTFNAARSGASNLGAALSADPSGSIVSPFTYVKGETIKMAASYRTALISLAINGADCGTLAATIASGLDRLILGNDNAVRPLNGTIARIRYFNRELSPAQIQALSSPQINPATLPDSFELSLLGFPNRLNNGEYLTIPEGSNSYGILFAFDGSPEWGDTEFSYPYPAGLTSYYISDTGDVQDNIWTFRIQHLVYLINLNSATLKYTASSADPLSGKLIITSTVLGNRASPIPSSNFMSVRKY